MNCKAHSRETAEHFHGKASLARMALNAGFDFVLTEHACADVVACKRAGAGWFTLALEFERRSRNVVRNIARDVACGAEHVMVVCPGLQVSPAIVRAAARSGHNDRVTVTTLNSTPAVLARLLENPTVRTRSSFAAQTINHKHTKQA